MDDTQRYITYVRERITDLRTQKDVSEVAMKQWAKAALHIC